MSSVTVDIQYQRDMVFGKHQQGSSPDYANTRLHEGQKALCLFDHAIDAIASAILGLETHGDGEISSRQVGRGWYLEGNRSNRTHFVTRFGWNHENICGSNTSENLKQSQV